MDEYPYSVAEERAGRNRMAMERALWNEARHQIAFEQVMADCRGLSSSVTRPGTRRALVACAERLSFSPLEISAAVDEALSKAGTTP